ncbi:hypothetical protein ACN28S_63075 [Cystobacter fuscus]
MVADTGREHVLFHQLLNREEIGAVDESKLHWSEFSSILNTIETLSNANRLDAKRFGFLSTHFPALRKINILRNKLWHRGSFVLRYRALDELIGRHIFPFVLDVVSHADFAKSYHPDGRRPPGCGIDPVKEIAASFKGNSYDPRRLAVLKEIGRATYANPLRQDSQWFNKENKRVQKHAEDKAASRANQNGNAAGILKCPVCGVTSLVGEQDFADEWDEEKQQPLPGGEPFVFKVECECCSFSLWDNVGNPGDYNIALPNYWDIAVWP